MKISEEKMKGRFYTPDFIVKNILDLAGYSGEKILGKDAIDNSCGDGAFLVEMVQRYCSAAKKSGYSADKLAEDLGTFIHGIEIDSKEHSKAVSRVADAAAQFGVTGVKWDIRNDDALEVKDYDGRMDYVLGNPPYVRVHHLAESYDAIKQFRFAREGMTDLFIVFYEIGIQMLKKGGTLGYITPSSLYNSRAAAELRAYLVRNHLIDSVVNLKHFQPFEATTYTTIMILRKENPSITEKQIKYYVYDLENQKPEFCSYLTSEHFYIDDVYYFGTKRALENFRKIALFSAGSPEIDVKNGFATLCDHFFIGEWDFENYLIPVVKASTGKKTHCLFPYDKNGRIVPYEELTSLPSIRQHYNAFTSKLKKRSLHEKDEWYGFGRTQGIKDVFKKKYSICPIIKTLNDLKIRFCGKGVGVYGGLYILTDIDQKVIEDILMNNDFLEYVEMLAKYKSGGYYTFSSKELGRFLCFKISEMHRSSFQK